MLKLFTVSDITIQKQDISYLIVPCSNKLVVYIANLEYQVHQMIDLSSFHTNTCFMDDFPKEPNVVLCRHKTKILYQLQI